MTFFRGIGGSQREVLRSADVEIRDELSDRRPPVRADATSGHQGIRNPEESCCSGSHFFPDVCLKSGKQHVEFVLKH